MKDARPQCEPTGAGTCRTPVVRNRLRYVEHPHQVPLAHRRAVGVVVFGVVMGVLFAVAYTVIQTVLERRGLTSDAPGLAMLLSAGMFAAIVVMPGLKYPANPPTVGLEETVGERSSSFLTITVVSVIAACAAVAAGLAWSGGGGHGAPLALRSTAFPLRCWPTSGSIRW